MDHEPGTERPSKRQRASRAGQAKRFECTHAGCGKRYSRAEHLHRHQLNHDPKQIYHCDFPNCAQSFVRQDLFLRHIVRHEESSSDTFATSGTAPSVTGDSGRPQSVFSPTITQTLNGHFHARTKSLTANVEQALPTPRPSTVPLSSTVAPSAIATHDLATSSLHYDQAWPTGALAVPQTNDNFAAWLFESPGSHEGELNLENLPFLDFGLDQSPSDIWNVEDLAVNPNASAPPPSPFTIAGREVRDEIHARRCVSDQRRGEILTLLGQFARKSPQFALLIEDNTRLIYTPDGHSFPNITLGALDNLIANYWLSSKQVPIIHEPTFSTNTCHVLLLLAMIAMGANDLVRSQAKGQMKQYRELADLIMISLRWEIFVDVEAQPPIQLWVAQALLLLEYYEKQCSTRKLHERGHIHHATTLTLLRRGSPLVGRSESETPTGEAPTRGVSPVNGKEADFRSEAPSEQWWRQWVRMESFNRVVFTAFQMDTLHAVMWGHAADMAPYEIRLPLPCDDSLWDARSAEEVQRLDGNLKMYGIRPTNFLEGLKKCLHSRDVQTHAPGRMLLMAGLLSVGWHISRREKHLQFIETVPSVRERGRWRAILLHAFGFWRSSFDEAVGVRRGGNVTSQAQNLSCARSAVLFHLAHMTMHADIIDCQIFAGTKRLLGRRVSKRDYLNVIQRMKSWACTPVARHAVLHAFKLLYETLVSETMLKHPKFAHQQSGVPTRIVYNCRKDPTIYRPWALFIAGLIQWSYQQASSLHMAASPNPPRQLSDEEEQAICCQYLSACAIVDDPGKLLSILSAQGCASVLNVLSQNFANGEPELLNEASKLLRECKNMLGSSAIDLHTK